MRMEFFATQFEFFAGQARFYAAQVELQRVKISAYVTAAGFYAMPTDRFAATVTMKQALPRFFAVQEKLNGTRVRAIIPQIEFSNCEIGRVLIRSLPLAVRTPAYLTWGKLNVYIFPRVAAPENCMSAPGGRKPYSAALGPVSVMANVRLASF